MESKGARAAHPPWTAGILRLALQFTQPRHGTRGGDLLALKGSLFFPFLLVLPSPFSRILMSAERTQHYALETAAGYFVPFTSGQKEQP